MVYQRVSKPSSGNSQIHKKDSASTAHTIPVQAKSVSASPQEQEMPSYTPLAANWATNNNLMRSLSGNQVVQRQEESGEEEMEPIQAKLTIGEVGDKYEQEADQTAQQVVNQINAPAPQQSTQGQPLQREEMPEDEELQMKPMVQLKSDGGGMDATPDIEASIQQAKGVQRTLQTQAPQPTHPSATSLKQDESRQKESAASRQDISVSQVSQNNTTELSTRLQRFGYNPFVSKRSLTQDLSHTNEEVNITEEQAAPLEKASVGVEFFMMHYRKGVSVEDMVQIAEFALNKFPKGGEAAFEVTKYLFNAKLLMGSAQQFTHKNLTLLYSLWNELKVVATQQLVSLVVNCAADNPLRGLLYALLKEGITLNAISIDLLNHLKPFSNTILVDTQALLRAHTVATDHPEDLAKLEEWGFDRANYDAAQIHAEEAKQKHLTEGMTKIETSEKTKQNKALQDKLEIAKEKLIGNEAKRKKAFPAEPPQLKSSLEEYNKNQKNLKSKQEELAAEDFAAFAQERLVEESQLNSDAEQVSTTDQQNYKSYLATVNYHKKAPQALKFAQDNFNDATKIVLAMQQAPAIETIVEGSQLSKDALISCIDILGATNLVMIPTPTLKQFAEKRQRLELLHQMQSDNINLVKIQGLVSEFGTFDKYCDPGSVPHFSNLLINYTLAEIKNLLSASLNAAAEGQRMVFLVNIMPYAQSAADMVNFLKIAKMVSEKCQNSGLVGQWQANAIQLALQTDGQLGMDEKALKKLIVTNVLTEINKQAYFSSWIDVLNVLIKEDLAILHKINDWYALPGNGTQAIEYEVQAKDGGTVLEDFVAHWHPGATSATTSNPNASKKHLKPIHGNLQTQRVYEGGVPKPLADKLLWGTH